MVATVVIQTLCTIFTSKRCATQYVQTSRKLIVVCRHMHNYDSTSLQETNSSIVKASGVFIAIKCCSVPLTECQLTPISRNKVPEKHVAVQAVLM